MTTILRNHLVTPHTQCEHVPKLLVMHDSLVQVHMRPRTITRKYRVLDSIRTNETHLSISNQCTVLDHRKVLRWPSLRPRTMDPNMALEVRRVTRVTFRRLKHSACSQVQAITTTRTLLARMGQATRWAEDDPMCVCCLVNMVEGQAHTHPTTTQSRQRVHRIKLVKIRRAQFLTCMDPHLARTTTTLTTLLARTRLHHGALVLAIDLHSAKYSKHLARVSMILNSARARLSS